MMSTERLKTLHRQAQTQRKFVCVMNDVAKTKQDLYEGYIEKEKQELVQKCNKSIVVTRRNIVRQQVLKHCMKNKRDEVEKNNARKIFGKYNGVSVEQIAQDVDPFIKKNHPKNRRQKKIQALFRDGFEKGAILDNDAMHNKVSDYFERPLVAIQHFDHFEDAKKKEYQLPPIKKPFYTGDVQQVGKAHMRELVNKIKHNDTVQETCDDGDVDEEKLFVRRKVTKFLNEDVPDDMSVLSEAPPSENVSNKRGQRPLTLPPIKLGTDKEDVVHIKKPKAKKDYISDVINRIHQAKDNREREIKIKKEKRAKRLQHERVFGVGSYTTSESSRNDLYTSQTERPAREFETLTPFNTNRPNYQQPFHVVETQTDTAVGSGLRLPPI
ncbi:hypothetical protein ACF0H5_021591 [Mactra antiquata]